MNNDEAIRLLEFELDHFRLTYEDVVARNGGAPLTYEKPGSSGATPRGAPVSDRTELSRLMRIRWAQASEGGDHVAQPFADMRRVEPHDGRSAGT